jgi:hypothetical protein
VNPLPHAKLISQSSRFCVKLAEPLVARGLVPPELPQDGLTVSNHAEWCPLVCLCCSEALQHSAVFGLVVGGCGFGRLATIMKLAHLRLEIACKLLGGRVESHCASVHRSVRSYHR